MITKEMMYQELQEARDKRPSGADLDIQKAKEFIGYLSDNLCPDDLYSLDDSVHMIWNKGYSYDPVSISVGCYPNDYVVTINVLFDNETYYNKDIKMYTSMVRPVLSLIRSYVE